MNMDYPENSSPVVAKTCGCKNSKRKVTYVVLDQYHYLCLDKKDLLEGQIQACEKLLKYAQDDEDKKTVEKEIVDLKMALDLLT